MPQASGMGGTLYEQVLEHARHEIDEATSKVDEMRRSLQLLEARVEAAKAVYEAVAARLNLEDEQEDGITLQESSFSVAPPPHVPEPPTESPFQTPAPPEPQIPSKLAQPASTDQAAEPSKPSDAPAGGGNGSFDGLSADLIRKHLERRAERSVAEGAAPVPPPAPPPAPANLVPPAVVTPPTPPPAAPEPAAAETTPEPVSGPDSPPSQPASGGGFELSEADRALIGEYLKSKQKS